MAGRSKVSQIKAAYSKAFRALMTPELPRDVAVKCWLALLDAMPKETFDAISKSMHEYDLRKRRENNRKRKR